MLLALAFAVITYTGIGDGIADNTATFNAAVAEACSSPSTRTLIIPVGKYRFGSPPDAIPCALNIRGEGKAVTWLLRDYSGQGGYFLKLIGGQDTYGGGTIKDLSIYTSPNGTDGIAVWVLAHQDTDPNALSTNPHGLLIDNVQIGRYGATGGWSYGIYLDGTQNPGANGTAPGIRAVTVRNTSVSVASQNNYTVNTGYGIKFDGVECYGGPGIWLGGASSIIDIFSASCPVTNSGATTVRIYP